MSQASEEQLVHLEARRGAKALDKLMQYGSCIHATRNMFPQHMQLRHTFSEMQVQMIQSNLHIGVADFGSN